MSTPPDIQTNISAPVSCEQVLDVLVFGDPALASRTLFRLEPIP